MGRFAAIVVVPLLLARLGTCDCGSYGKDYVHGGAYCIDTRKEDFFSFGTGFWGCSAEDTQGGVEPILVDPNNDDFFCSTIQTQPDDKTMTSTCNIAGNEIRKSSMTSGNYTIVIEGLTFAYNRVFSIIAGPPVEVTSTAAVTIQETSTPITTVTTTTTSTLLTTLAPVTVTKPSATNTVTVTVTPKRVTSTTTNVKTITLPAWLPKITTTTVTKTETTSCKIAARRNDPTCTVHPPKASLAAAAADRSSRRRRAADRVPRAPLPENANHLARRTADLCTSTVIASSVITTTTTSTAPTSTISSTVVEFTTFTVTPTPVTVYSGAVYATTTTTLPTQTHVVTLYGLTIVRTTPTYTATLTKTVKVAPSGKACLAW